MLRNFRLTAFPIRDEELAEVKATAHHMGVSQAEVIRRAIMAYVGKCPTCRRVFPSRRGAKKVKRRGKP